FPVALKALGLVHKTEAGGLRLNLATPEAVYAAADELAGIGSGLYVEKMVKGPLAEILVGVTRDPPFGLVMTLGSGGILVELLRDTATLLLPATRSEIEAALRSLRCAPLLQGFRGQPAADVAAAVDAIDAVQRLALAEAATIVELEINPLIVSAEGAGAFAADVLVVRRCTDA